MLEASDAAYLGAATTATAAAVSTVSRVDLAATSAAAIGVTALGFQSGSLRIGSTPGEEGASGLVAPPLAPGFAPSQTYERVPVPG